MNIIQEQACGLDLVCVQVDRLYLNESVDGESDGLALFSFQQDAVCAKWESGVGSFNLAYLSHPCFLNFRPHWDCDGYY